MQTTVGELAYLLLKMREQGAPCDFTLRAPDVDAVIEHVRIWPDTQNAAGCLCLTDAHHADGATKEMNGDQSKGTGTVAHAGDLSKGTGSVAHAGPAAKETAGPVALLVCAPTVSVERMFGMVADCLLGLESWDSRLKDALFNAVSIDGLFSLGAEMIPELLGLVDPDLTVIVDGLIAQNPEEYSKDITRDAQGRQQLANGLIEELLLADDFPHAAREQGVFFYPVDPAQAQYICGNVFAGEEYCARLVSRCPQGLTARERRGLSCLLEHFLGYVRQAFLRDWQDERALNLNDTLHRMFRQMLEGSMPTSSERVHEAASGYRWQTDDQVIVIEMVFFEGAYWLNMANYICGRLEQTVPRSAAAAVNGRIAWVCNLSQADGFEESELFERLAPIVRDYTCRAGISRRLEGIDQIPVGFAEASIALEIGQKRAPHLWCYRFGDFASTYLLERMTGELPVSQLVHPGIERLKRYDAAHGTDYLTTLRLYFDCGYNVTEAAARAFVHRTTFSRRLERIGEVGLLDPHDPEARLSVVLSFWMLDQTAAVKGEEV